MLARSQACRVLFTACLHTRLVHLQHPHGKISPPAFGPPVPACTPTLSACDQRTPCVGPLPAKPPPPTPACSPLRYRVHKVMRMLETLPRVLLCEDRLWAEVPRWAARSLESQELARAARSCARPRHEDRSHGLLPLNIPLIVCPLLAPIPATLPGRSHQPHVQPPLQSLRTGIGGRASTGRGCPLTSSTRGSLSRARRASSAWRVTSPRPRRWSAGGPPAAGAANRCARWPAPALVTGPIVLSAWGHSSQQEMLQALSPKPKCEVHPACLPTLPPTCSEAAVFRNDVTKPLSACPDECNKRG